MNRTTQKGLAPAQARQLLACLKREVTNFRHPARGDQLNPVDAFFAYRLFLERNPDPDQELPRLLSDGRTFREFLGDLLVSDEFAAGPGFMPPNRVLMAQLKEFRFWFNTSDREMGVMMAMGRYEPSSVALVNEFVRPGMHCVDVGAHNGYFTCLMASLIGPTGRVDSFEPRPQSFDLLEQNVRENRFESIVTTHRLAASDRSGTIDVSHVSHMYVIGRVHNAPKATAQTARIDDAVGGPVDLVKLDVEGHEPLAIDGMRSTIASSRPVILSEANEYWLRHCSQSNASDYCSLLRSLGYEVFDVESRQPIGRLDLQENDVVNLVAFPRGPG